jgi:hypothetical protein
MSIILSCDVRSFETSHTNKAGISTGDDGSKDGIYIKQDGVMCMSRPLQAQMTPHCRVSKCSTCTNDSLVFGLGLHKLSSPQTASSDLHPLGTPLMSRSSVVRSKFDGCRELRSRRVFTTPSANLLIRVEDVSAKAPINYTANASAPHGARGLSIRAERSPHRQVMVST